MENKKYISSNERLYIKLDRAELGMDDAMLDLYFLENELSGDKSDFIKAVCKMMLYAIKNTSNYEINHHNYKDCEKNRYIRMFIEGTADFEKVKKILIKACELIEKIKLNREATNPNNALVCKYQDQVKAYATEIKNDLINGTDFSVYSQFIPFN